MPAPQVGGKVYNNAIRHLRLNDEMDVTDAIAIARMVATGQVDAALERLERLARRNQQSTAIGLYLEMNQITDADDVIMTSVAEQRKDANAR